MSDPARADVFFLVQADWDRLYRVNADRNSLVTDPSGHPMVLEGYSLVWCSDIRMWASCDHEAYTAVTRAREAREQEIRDAKEAEQ